MKIDGTIINYEIKKYLMKSTPNETRKLNENQSSVEQKVEANGQTQGDTVVNISQASKEARLIREIVLSEPESREDKVSTTKENIESGRYTVDCEAVADRLVDAFIDEIS
jgi:flagellar biosynthesis anti-sigma factor FlgM